MKYQIFKAVDKIDGELSLFLFDEENGYTVIDYSPEMMGRLISDIKAGGSCHWSDNEGETSRRDDMLDAVLMCEFEAE
ncbi:hypothetical protein CPL00172_CDS0082 [Escherichia phage BubbaBully]